MDPAFHSDAYPDPASQSEVCCIVNVFKICTFPTEITPWCLEIPFIECLEESRTKPGSYFTYFMYAAPYSLEGSERFTSFCAHPCVCVCVYSMMHGGQWCMFMWACFGMLCMGGGGEVGGRSSMCTVNVPRRFAGLAYLGTVSETARQENLSGF
jgi:hypothetical protein